LKTAEVETNTFLCENHKDFLKARFDASFAEIFLAFLPNK
jgi:hypothetical protein